VRRRLPALEVAIALLMAATLTLGIATGVLLVRSAHLRAARGVAFVPNRAVLDSANNWVVSCAADFIPRRPMYAPLTWRLFEPGARGETMGHAIIGEWVPGDTIFIDRDYVAVVWLYAHELLHRALRGPPAGWPAHPWVPFAFPCMLMEFQNEGGIMGPPGTPKEQRP